MNVFILILLAVLIIYVYQIGRWKYHWDHTAEFTPSAAVNAGISVIVAFRNERKNIETLLACLQKQAYPHHLFEVILVDDNSNDSSDTVVKQVCGRFTNYRYVSNSGNPAGKKSAIRTGIRHASYELIVTTDADAVMPEKWLATISSFYQEKKPELIIGLTDLLARDGFTNEFMEAEFISLVASGAAAATADCPIYCSGANLAFTKRLYNESLDSMKDRIVSGDDTFMLHSAKKSGDKILLLKSLNALVTVVAPGSISEFVNQHKRWISKSRHYTDRDIIYTALIVFITNLMIVISFILLITTGLLVFLLLWLLKSVMDLLLLRSFYNYLGKKQGILKFMLFTLVYPFYVVIISFSGLFTSFTWKGRMYKSSE